MVVAAGMDWNSPYSCKDWVKKFMLTFPVIDDTKGRSIYNHFGDGIVPFNIVINRYGQLVYSKSGFNKDEIIKVIEESLDLSKKKNGFNYPKILKNVQQTRYELLRSNKGFDK